jgi:hypothetical protein
MIDSAAPQQGADPREKFREGERFYKVFVSAGVQSEHPILHGVLGCEDQHRGRDTSLPQGSQHFQSIPSRQHQIQSDQVKYFAIRKGEPFLARMSYCNVIELGFQAFLQRPGHLPFVFTNMRTGLPPL